MESGSLVSAASVLEAAVRASGKTLTPYQEAFLRDRSSFRAVLKARQTGFSWLFALEALTAAIERRRFSLFVSLTREEASEKVLYARDLYEGLPAERRPRLLRGSAHEMVLEGGGRLLSFPCRAPRGKASADLYLDEAAFYPDAERVYAGALPVVSHGGRVTIASTPGGEAGPFWRATVGGDLADSYSQHRVAWWSAPWLCRDVRNAERYAQGLETEARVERFGADVLRRLYAAMERTAFQQEYELRFVEHGDAYIPWEEIEPNVEDLPLAGTWADLAAEGRSLCAGMDIGRVHDPTVIVVVRDDGEACRVRLVRFMARARFEEQEAAASGLLAIAGVRRLCIDATGIGRQLSERLVGRYRERVVPLHFSVPLKETLASRVRRRLQAGTLRLPRHQELLDQVHSIRGYVTASRHLQLDAPRDDSGHADAFWALAMALQALEHPGGLRVRTILGR